MLKIRGKGENILRMLKVMETATNNIQTKGHNFFFYLFKSCPPNNNKVQHPSQHVLISWYIINITQYWDILSEIRPSVECDLCHGGTKKKKKKIHKGKNKNKTGPQRKFGASAWPVASVCANYGRIMFVEKRKPDPF